MVAAVTFSSHWASAQGYGGYPAWDGYPDGTPGMALMEQGSPAVMLRDGVERLTRFLQRRPSQRALAAYLEKEVAPWFDFDYMAEWAAGRHLRQLDEDQFDDLSMRLKQSFLEKMTQKLVGYSQQRASFLPPRALGNDQITLPVLIEHPGNGYPARLEFQMRKTDQGWKVVDVSANGMSALVFYRQMFDDMVRQAPNMR
jgi:phospholipid transport system substrate-binding protein